MDKLEELLARLKAEQREIILQVAGSAAAPAHSQIQRIGELELAIGAVEQQMGDIDTKSETD
ncbi:hypothetical protein GCM10019059_42740 [Camelimonas fluminis]|uniref:Uncharacterized protein n=1 Tax=Camelimonas fluminis TaxID=1576911 RepID=A0ABV7UBV0_9HYPH|nr:hypothetical protein [Camelimonas fluminis]GHE79731.1 hypothetical protein GCM10019059_42740 [Camelimonas fluminis]